MGLLDHLKDKAEELGLKAKGGLGAAKDKASDLAEDVKERLDSDDSSSAEQRYDAVLDAAQRRADALLARPESREVHR